MNDVTKVLLYFAIGIVSSVIVVLLFNDGKDYSKKEFVFDERHDVRYLLSYLTIIAWPMWIVGLWIFGLCYLLRPYKLAYIVYTLWNKFKSMLPLDSIENKLRKIAK